MLLMLLLLFVARETSEKENKCGGKGNEGLSGRTVSNGARVYEGFRFKARPLRGVRTTTPWHPSLRTGIHAKGNLSSDLPDTVPLGDR
jgi:hypothetical protein